MEAALLPQVLDTFDEISKTWKKITKVQEKRLTHLQRGEKIVPATEKRYEKLTQELVALMEGVHFNNNRLEQLVDQLYGLNRRLLTFEGKMLRMAERCGVDRQDFLDHYFGRELDPRWVSRVDRKSTRLSSDRSAGPTCTGARSASPPRRSGTRS